MGKKTIPQELAYVIGMTALAFGGALMARADFGVSMVVAPAYVLHLKLSQTMSWVTFGVMTYMLEALLLLVLGLVLRRFTINYLLSFVTAFLFGELLDGFMFVTSFLEGAGIPVRVVCFLVGMPLEAFGVANMFRTYFAPEAYEMVVKELADRYHWDIGKTKTTYDFISSGVAVLLSFAFFGLWHFEGVKLGTILCTIVNGTMISLIGKWLDRRFEFKRILHLKKKKD